MLSEEFIEQCNFAQYGLIDRIIFINGKNKSLNTGFLVVTDSNVVDLVPFIGDFSILVLPDPVVPTIGIVEYVRLKSCGKKLLAFGGGTISDICKYASYLDGVDFAVCPTAPSVNGYTSMTASIIKDGISGSYDAHLPKLIYLSLDILTDAPIRLIKSGFCEVICRFTAQVDWLLSHLLLGTFYSDVPFNLVLQLESQLICEREKLLSREPKVIQMLIEILILSGLGMNISGGSYSSSQGEHQIVHTMEMYNKNNEFFHGEKVGVTTFTMSHIQNFVLSCGIGKNRYQEIEEKVFLYYGESHVDILRAKHNKLKFDNWDCVFFDKIKKIIIDNYELGGILSSVGVSLQPQDVGWNCSEYRIGCEAACGMRERFTFLDLLPYSNLNYFDEINSIE